MYGDTTAIRRLAAGFKMRSARLLDEADRLVARTDSVGWLGRAGDALVESVRRAAAGLRRTAALHDDAAEALDRHAGRVEHRQALVADTEERFRTLVQVGDDQALAWLERGGPPPPGDPGWLDVEGLGG